MALLGAFRDSEIPERKEDEQIKADHLKIESPKPNSRFHVASTTAAKSNTDLSPTVLPNIYNAPIPQ